MFDKHLLDNGARLLMVPRKDTETATLLVGFRVGSRYEPQKINGVSHFLEHLMFKGTKKRPTTLDLTKSLDSVGAEYNAFTSKDHTGYYVKIDHKKIELALDILSDMLINSKFDPTEMEREKKVIVEEINMYEDNPTMFVDDLFEQVIYQGNPLGWQISGSREVLTSIPRADALKFKEQNYGSDKMVIGLAGKLGSDTLKLVKKYFGKYPGDKAKAATNHLINFEFPAFVMTQKKPAVKLHWKNTEQVQLAVGVPAYSHFDPKRYALSLLSIIMGGNMSSRLFIAVRERRGLAYHVRAGVNNYQDTGNFVVQAGLDKARLNDALSVILEELDKVRTKGVTPDELKRAKDFVRGKMTIELEDSSQLAVWFVTQELLKNEITTPEEKIKKIMAVTTDDIKLVANELLQENLLNLAMIGPYKDEAPFLKLLKF